jgi:NADPH2:quinone reductase
VVSESIVARKPAGLSFEEAAAIPLAGGTAWEAIVRRLQVRPGETVLIQGGAGGVGSFAVQFAKAAGARVLASASAENLETLKQLGADVAIDYAEEHVPEVALEVTGGRGVDAVFDIAGENLVSRSLPASRPFGRIACILPPQGNLTQLYRDNMTLYGVFLTREAERLDDMRPLFERGQAKPLVDEVLPLEKVSKAHRRLDSGHGRGKIVLRVAET